MPPAHRPILIDVHQGEGSDAIAGVVSGVSVSHKSADVGTIERASTSDISTELEGILGRDPVEEAFILQTCNRAERYVVTCDVETGRDVLETYLADVPTDAQTWLSHEGALEHLLRVGAGLESMVIGEDQILGQLRQACEEANQMGALGPLLEESVWKAIHLGKRVRTETDINEGVRSISRAAVDRADEHVPLQDAIGIVVGAGGMAERAAMSFVDAGVEEVLIANRTIARARDLAGTLPGETGVLSLEDLPETFPDVDVVITATASSSPIISADDVRGATPLVVIDMGQPRDVASDVNGIDGIDAFDLDDLESVTDATDHARTKAARAVEAMIAEELVQLQTQLKRKQADDVIAGMYAGADAIKQRELAEVRSRLSSERDLTEREVDILESFADAIVGKLMAAPTKSLREAAERDEWETIQVALQLFDPDFPSGSARSDRLPESGTGQVPVEEDR